jgi:hypothetical protein
MLYPMKSFAPLPWRLLKGLLTWLVGLVIVFEEWGWAPLARLLGVFARLPFIAWLERRIAALPPALALLVFLAPLALLLPVKIGALWLIGRGKAVLGLGVIVLAKVIGTGVAARLFMLTRPQLMRLPWFARVYARWVTWKQIVMAHVRASLPWRVARSLRRRWRIAARRSWCPARAAREGARPHGRAGSPAKLPSERGRMQRSA